MKLILAVSSTGGIAKEGKLPWKLPKELEFFKQMTMQGVVIMGRKTFDSIGKRTLPERENIVIGHGHVKFEDAVQIGLQRETEGKIVWVIGGTEIAEAFKPYITESFLSLIHGKFDCDLFAPQYVIDSVATIQRLFYNSETRDESETKRDICAPVVYYNSENFTVYRCFYTPNKEEQQFQSLIQRIDEEGVIHGTKIKTKSVFGHQLSFSLKDGKFPMSTLRKCYFKGIFEELMWFLRGQTNNQILNEKGVKIWDGNSSREALDYLGLTHLKEGDCGPIYGFQWRHWGAKYENCHTDYTGKGIDQIAKLIHEIKTNPFSRRLLLSGWNVQDLEEMCLPPCHTFYQFEVSPSDDGKENYLSCHYYQRSSDFLLAGHWNITSASLLTILIAHQCGLRPNKIVVSYGNVHIYKNHQHSINEHLIRFPFEYPTIEILCTPKEDISEYDFNDVKISNYRSHPQIKLDMNV